MHASLLLSIRWLVSLKQRKWLSWDNGSTGGYIVTHTSYQFPNSISLCTFPRPAPAPSVASAKILALKGRAGKGCLRRRKKVLHEYYSSKRVLESFCHLPSCYQTLITVNGLSHSLSPFTTPRNILVPASSSKNSLQNYQSVQCPSINVNRFEYTALLARNVKGLLLWWSALKSWYLSPEPIFIPYNLLLAVMWKAVWSKSRRLALLTWEQARICRNELER